MKMFVVIVIVGFTLLMICILQLSTFYHTGRNYLRDSTFYTTSRLTELPVSGVDNGHKPTPTADQCVLRENPTSQKAGVKFLEKRLPKCLIIGFAKCGTYALRSFLTLHPDIVCPNRELAFFSKYYHRGIDWYRGQMPVSLESQVTIEKTPSYILSLDALYRIRKFNASIKLIISVRDPLIRLQSSYAHARASVQRFNETFESWLKKEGNIVRAADYVSHIQDVFRLFVPSQVLVVQEEELEDRPLGLLRNVENFLGLCHALTHDLLVFNSDKGFYCFNQSSRRYRELEDTLTLNHKTGCFSRSKGRTHPQIDPPQIQQLVARITPYNEQLFAFLGRRFNWTHAGSL